MSFFSVHEHIAELLNEMMSEVRAETRKQLAGELRAAGVTSTEKWLCKPRENTRDATVLHL